MYSVSQERKALVAGTEPEIQIDLECGAEMLSYSTNPAFTSLPVREHHHHSRVKVTVRPSTPEEPVPQPPKPELPPQGPPDPDMPGRQEPPLPEIPDPAPGFPDVPVVA